MRRRIVLHQHCGNIIATINNSSIPIQCCDKDMQEIIPGTTEASEEKHIPAYITEDDTVTVSVGSVEHPMTPPKANFSLSRGDRVKAVYTASGNHN